MKKAKLVIMLGMLSLVLGLMCVGVFASQSVSYGLNGTITYKVENNIEATSNALNLSATANCSHVSATSGTGVTGSNISNYFKVIYNGSEQNQTQITSLINSGTLVVSATSNVIVSSGLVKMSNLTSSASTSQNLSLSLKFSGGSAVTKTGTGTITRSSPTNTSKYVSSSSTKEYDTSTIRGPYYYTSGGASCTSGGWEYTYQYYNCKYRTKTTASGYNYYCGNSDCGKYLTYSGQTVSYSSYSWDYDYDETVYDSSWESALGHDWVGKYYETLWVCNYCGESWHYEPDTCLGEDGNCGYDSFYTEDVYQYVCSVCGYESSDYYYV